MACERYKERLLEAAVLLSEVEGEAGGELAQVRDAKLRTHLASCAACREEFEGQQLLVGAIDRGLAEGLRDEPSPEFAARVRQRLREEPIAGRSWYQGWVPAAAGALAVLVLVAVWLARNPIGEPDRREQALNTAHSQPTPSVARATEGAGSRQARSGSSKSSAAQMRAGTGIRRVRLTPEPEVLVAPGQEESILRFYAAVWSGRADISVLGQMESGRLDELKIPPLEVAPLDVEAKPSEPGKGR